MRKLILATLVAALAASIGPVIVLRWVPPPTTAFMLIARHGDSLSQPRCTRIEQQWVDWDHISGDAKLAVIAAEDQRFPIHNGFDWQAIGEAVEDRARGGRLRGASTLSQQLAKNLFLWPDRSWSRKALEAYFTTLIEATWSKRRILETYLNVAQFDRCVFGIEAAARNAFGKSAAGIETWEAAKLAAVLPHPARYRAAPPSPYVRERAAWIIEQMRMLGGERYLAGL